VRDHATGRRVGRIVEVEAYGGPDDRASHARFVSQGRNRVMSGPAGIAYVYLVYGMYDCLNVVVGPAGTASAVLLRAAMPIEGIQAMRAGRLAVAARRRSLADPARAAAAEARLAREPITDLARGPGRLAAVFGIDTSWTGRDLCDPNGALRLEPAAPDDEPLGPIVAGPRVGVGYAGEPWASRPWRFAIAGHPAVSRPPVGA
jgi:DNA-3-methyladenine glycosylase